MKAGVLLAPEHVAVTDWPSPVIGDDQVLVAIDTVGICGSDLSAYRGHRGAETIPKVMGHEGIGRVVALGAKVTTRSVGDRVVIEPNFCCFECDRCLEGLTSSCQRKVIVGGNYPGLLASMAAVPAAFAWPIARTLNAADAVAIEPLAVAVAALRRSGVSAGDTCLVVGAGSQGLLACLALLEAGVRPGVTDPDTERVQVAVELGATACEDPQAVQARYVFETSGTAAGLATALGAATPGAVITAIGLSDAALPLTMEQLVRGQLSVRGSLIYDHPADFARTIDLVTSGRILPSSIVAAEYLIDHVSEAFARAHRVPGKSIIHVT